MKKYVSLILGIILTGSLFAATSVTILSPNGGEKWTIGCPSTIQWTTNAPSSVKIELYKGNELVLTICEQTVSGVNTYKWTPPWTIAQGNMYRLRITNLTNPIDNLTDFSDKSFTIAAPSAASVNCPVFSVYPNPCSDNLHLKFSGNSYSTMDIRIVSFMGETVFLKEYLNLRENEDLGINTTIIKPGNYFLIVHSVGETVFHTMVEVN